jgi:hypothetical protein
MVPLQQCYNVTTIIVHHPGENMGPYSHYFLAAKLEPSIRPENRKEYYWGAVAPDIRYLANVRRAQTHLEQDYVRKLISCYPHLQSFLSGYQVHILIDQFDQEKILRMVSGAFPLNLLKKMLRKAISPEQMTMLVEMYYLQTGPVEMVLSGEHNVVLTDLGITSEQTVLFQQALQEYFRNRTFEAALSAFQKIGMIQNTRIEKYKNAYRKIQQRKVINNLFLLSVKNARLDAQVIEHVRSKLKN